jgi:C4-dicarboxylate transporter DctQ subunit
VRKAYILFGRLEEGLLAVILAAMTLLTFLQVVLRYGFNSGLTWALEASTYLFGWMVLLGISYGVRVNAHIGVDVLVKQLGPRGYRIAVIAASLLSLLYAAIMLYGSVNYLVVIHTLGVEADDLPIQRWVLVSVLPLGFGLLGLRLLGVTWRLLTGRSGPAGPAAEARRTLERLAGTAPPSQGRP